MTEAEDIMRTTGRPSFWRRPRWRYAAAAFLLGVGYTVLAVAFGFEFRLGEHDVTLWVGALVEVSFAGFGYLIGLITEARQRERAAAEEAAGRLQQLGRVRARLAQAEKLASLGELASAISHELRNPLAILRAMAQNLEESPSPDAARQTCREMLDEIDRLSRVTARLMDFARPVEPERRRVPVAEIAERTGTLAEELLRSSPVQLEIRGGGSGTLEADPDLICQVLLGLLENAAAVSQTTVELSWHQRDEAVILEIADRGPGVPVELRQRIFEPFFSRREGGHGLGLAVARQIVEAHGGRIEVVDRPGGGAIFRLLLPRAAALESAA